MPRTTFVRLPSDKFEYDPRSRKSGGSRSWAHSTSSRPRYGSDGEPVGGDGVNRESVAHPVVVGTAGRPSNLYAAVMECPPGTDPLEDAESVQASMDRVDAMLALLPPVERQVVSLVVLERHSLREAGPVVGLSKSQVDRILKRGLAMLAELLGGDLPQPETLAALAELAPAHAPELGDYQEPDGQVDAPPATSPVSPEEWERYGQAEARLSKGTASNADLAYVAKLERRAGLGYSFSPAWR